MGAWQEAVLVSPSQYILYAISLFIIIHFYAYYSLFVILYIGVLATKLIIMA